MEKNNPYRIALNKLITSIDAEVPLEEQDQVLLLMQLDTEEKVSKFNAWIKTKMNGNSLQTTAAEIMNQSAKISKA